MSDRIDNIKVTNKAFTEIEQALIKISNFSSYSYSRIFCLKVLNKYIYLTMNITFKSLHICIEYVSGFYF